MTVQELIAELEDFDPKSEVHFAYDYGDHVHTRVAPVVKDVSEELVRFSDYHRMPALADADEDRETKTVVVLFS